MTLQQLRFAAVKACAEKQYEYAAALDLMIATILEGADKHEDSYRRSLAALRSGTRSST